MTMQRLFAFKHALLVVAATLLLSACGFHLRGAVPISADKQHVYLTTEAAFSGLEKALRQTLTDNGVTVTNGAPYTLDLGASQFKREASVISTSGVVTVYTVRLEVSYSLTKPASEQTADFTEVMERNYSYDTNAAAANAEQEAVIKQELLQATANRILRRFVAFDQ